MSTSLLTPGKPGEILVCHNGKAMWVPAKEYQALVDASIEKLEQSINAFLEKLVKEGKQS